MCTIKDIDIAIVKHFRAIGKCKTLKEFDKLKVQRQNISKALFNLNELQKECDFFGEWVELYRNFKVKK